MAKKLSVPWRTHPDSREKGEEPPAWVAAVWVFALGGIFYSVCCIALVGKGRDFQVVDAKTGKDLTRVVLTQIIVEDAKGQPAGLPLELLRQLIVASDRAGQEFIMWYRKSAFDAYGKVQETLQDRLTDVRAAAMSPLSMVKNFFTPPAPAEPDGEVEQLRRRSVPRSSSGTVARWRGTRYGVPPASNETLGCYSLNKSVKLILIQNAGLFRVVRSSH